MRQRLAPVRWSCLDRHQVLLARFHMCLSVCVVRPMRPGRGTLTLRTISCFDCLTMARRTRDLSHSRPSPLLSHSSGTDQYTVWPIVALHKKTLFFQICLLVCSCSVPLLSSTGQSPTVVTRKGGIYKSQMIVESS